MQTMQQSHLAFDQSLQHSSFGLNAIMNSANKLVMNDNIKAQNDFILQQMAMAGLNKGNQYSSVNSPLPMQIASPKLHSTLTEA